MITLQELVDALAQAGMPASIEGDSQKRIAAVSTLEDAGPDDISFLANPKYEKSLASTQAGAILVDERVSPPKRLTLVRTKDPYAALQACIVRIHGYRRHPQWGIHPAAHIHADARVGERANIGPFAVVDSGAEIGDDVTLYPGSFVGHACTLGDEVTLYNGVVVYEHCVLGNRVTIHANSVIGEDGLGYAPVNGEWHKIPQVGHVIIADDVELGANCCIDRATLGSTVIGRGSKFSNLIAVGHGTKIGERAMLVAQVGMAGSVTVGKRVQIGGQVGIAGHLRIGDDARIGAKAGVAADVADGDYVLGQPAMKATDARRALTLTQKLPAMRDRLRALETQCNEMREQLDARKAEEENGAAR
jgi:UDP-3-O-[3-hydroxymyristoyl] glucosamine N-acyltransferase